VAVDEAPTEHVSPASVSAAEIAQAAGAADLFVFRRIAEDRFAHLGGVGRGAGWAGILEIGVEDEPLVRGALADGSVAHRSLPEPWHVLGPYYAHAVAVVPVSKDAFVIFGFSSDRPASQSDHELLRLARLATEEVDDVGPAKRLADELEALNAVRDLLYAPAETYHEALQRLVEQSTTSLSCDLGLAYIGELREVWISDRRGQAALDASALVDVLAAIADRDSFPVCIQDASAAELPAPLGSPDGVLAYYLLEITHPLRGVLVLLHTTASPPRGFTLLCQSLGKRLVEAAEPLLAAARLRDVMGQELERAATEARRDPLTGLANRLAWNEALSSAWACAQPPVSIIQLDCRDLKLINDTYGQHVGDQLLCRVANALTSSVRSDDLVVRLGGDEFAILLCGADEEISHTVVGRIEAAIAVDRGPDQPEIQLAIGASTTREADLEATQQRADVERLKAKRLWRRTSRRRAAG
jgi:diguanylate cyclase (GGDEF)-like protein